MGLRPEEFDQIKTILGRTPNFTEMCVYSVMWSEHCSYKNSIKWLKTLPKEGPHMLVKAGEENAGIVDIGDGLGCAFKIESHNHPSAIEPYQGAATGVGGINRDIFTMGARPIAQLNSLRFGDLSNPRTKWLLEGRGQRHWRLRQQLRGAHRGRRSVLRQELPSEPPRQRDVGGDFGSRQDHFRHGFWPWQPGVHRGVGNRQGRHPRRVVRVQGHHGGKRRRPAIGAGGRSVQGKVAP